MNRLILCILLFSVSLSAFSQDKIEAINRISGIYCKVDVAEDPKYDRLIDLGVGAYLDFKRHYLWLELNDSKELSLKIFQKRKHIIGLMDLVIDDKLVFEDLINLKDLSSYQDDEVILEYDLDFENGVIGNNLGRPNDLDRLTCLFTRNGKINSKIYLDNKVNIIRRYKDRNENNYELNTYKEASELYYLEDLYEQGKL